LARKKIENDEAKCHVCKKLDPNLSEFNRALLCASCFHDEVAAYAEGRSFEKRVAIS
jgi:hypothetical protein